MDFELTEEQELVKANMKEFCEKYVEPIADQVDQEARFPARISRDWPSRRCWVSHIPSSTCGAGDYLTYIMTLEELSRTCAATGFVVEAHTSLACNPLYKFGSEAQKKKYLVPLCNGRYVGRGGINGTGSR